MRLQTPPATPRPRESSRYLTPPATPGRGARELRTPGFSYNTRGNTDVEKDDAREAESELMSVGKEVEGLTPRVHKGLNTMLERYRPLEVDDAVADATRAVPPAAGSFTATAGSIDAMMMVDAEYLVSYVVRLSAATKAGEGGADGSNSPTKNGGGTVPDGESTATSASQTQSKQSSSRLRLISIAVAKFVQAGKSADEKRTSSGVP